MTLTVALALGLPGSALAAAPHGLALPAPVYADIFSTIASAFLGAFSWTLHLAQSFVLTTLGALVRMLIPRSWAQEGTQIMGWIVAVPNYAGKITTPGGTHQYGFAGINDLRQLFVWLGIAIAPLTLTHATARALIDESEPVGIPILRVIAAAALILTYPYLWAQAANLADQVTHLILGLPAVADGLQKLMDYAVDGVALGGWQLIDLALIGAIGLALLGLIFMKVVLIVLGALLYATGPLMLGLVPTRFGHAIARAWTSSVMLLLGIGIVWATIFAVGALLINDAGTAGPLIAGNSSFGTLVGGLLLAAAGLVALWLCLRTAREAGGLLRMQLGGMLALGAGGLSSQRSSRPAAERARTSGASLRRFAGRVSAAGGAAGNELATAVPGGRHVRSAMRGTATAGRRGLAGTAAASARSGARRAAAPTAAMLGRSRAGAVAVRAARTGSAAYQHTTPSPVAAAGAPVAATADRRGRQASGSAGRERPAHNRERRELGANKSTSATPPATASGGPRAASGGRRSAANRTPVGSRPAAGERLQGKSSPRNSTSSPAAGRPTARAGATPRQPASNRSAPQRAERLTPLPAAPRSHGRTQPVRASKQPSPPPTAPARRQRPGKKAPSEERPQ